MTKNYYRSGDWNLIYKTCSKCKQELSAESFYKQKDGKFGLTSRCKVCVQKSNTTWKEANPDKAKQAQQHWVKEHKELCLSRTREWRKSNLQYDAFRARTYRARKQQQLPTWANLNKIKHIYLNCPKGYHVDHIIPLKGLLASGLHVETNLQYLPAKENLSKRNLYGWE